MGRAILHIDMDAFYASVEQRDNAKLRGKPVIVGGHPQRGVVLAASYEVRPFGVQSAMPMAWALRKAPQAIVVPPRFAAYAQASEQVFSVFEEVTPLVEPLSLDEAFLDVTASVALFGSPGEMATRIRRRIYEETALTASAGVAGVKFVAKIASDLAKPNGQKEIPAEHTVKALAPLPVARLWGVGPKMEATLKSLGISTIGALAERGRSWLEGRLGDTGGHLWELSQGLDSREVIPDRAAKSLGAEDTFAEDLPTPESLWPHLHAQSLRVGRRLRRAGLLCRSVQLKIKYADFSVLTRRQTFASATDDGQALYRSALELLARLAPRQKVRLTGVSAHDLCTQTPPAQLGLFADPNASHLQKAQRLNRALDAITERFGAQAIATADVAHTERPALDEKEDQVRRQLGASTLDTRRR